MLFNLWVVVLLYVLWLVVFGDHLVLVDIAWLGSDEQQERVDFREIVSIS